MPWPPSPPEGQFGEAFLPGSSVAHSNDWLSNLPCIHFFLSVLPLGSLAGGWPLYSQASSALGETTQMQIGGTLDFVQEYLKHGLICI